MHLTEEKASKNLDSISKKLYNSAQHLTHTTTEDFMKKILLLMVTLLASNIYAENSLELNPGKVECFEEVQMCTYVVQNIDASCLYTKLNRIMFSGSSIISDDGYIFVDSKVIRFWLNDAEKQERLKTLIPLLDTFEQFVPAPLVNFTTEIHSVSEKGYAYLQASAENFARAAIGAAEGEVNVTGSFKIRLNIDDVDLASILGAQIMKEESMKVMTINEPIINGGNINFSQMQTIPYAPTSGTAKEASVGISTSGHVSISRDNPDLVQINNYNMTFSVDDPSFTTNEHVRVSTLKIGAGTIYLTRNQSRIMISSNIIESSTSNGVGLTTVGTNRSKIYTKLVVIVRAESHSYEDYTNMTNNNEVNRKFTEDEIAAFPNDEVDLDNITESIKIHSSFSLSGDRILGFYLDSKLARMDNYKKDLVVRIKGGGIDTKEIRTLESLMLNGYTFTGLDPFKLDKEIIKIKIKLSEPKYRFYNFMRFKKKFTLFYFPSDNRFSERIDRKSR